MGYVKKVAIADAIAPMTAQAFDPGKPHTGAGLLLGIYLFALQIYGDFSGYSDIARGAARLLGFELMINFRQPYFSRNITEFWERWHVSLSMWLRDYIFVPLCRIFRGKKWMNFNLFLTMLISGLWHGASWNFVLWGALLGLMLVIHKLWSGKKAGKHPHRPKNAREWMVQIAGMVLTFHAVCLTLIFVKTQTLEHAWSYFSGIFKGGYEPTDVFALVYVRDLRTRGRADRSALLVEGSGAAGGRHCPRVEARFGLWRAAAAAHLHRGDEGRLICLLPVLTTHESDSSKPQTQTFRWFGTAGFIVVVMFLLGRIVAGQLRGVPQFDEHGMEPYSAVETFRLRKMPEPFEVGLFGSSVAIWGLIPEIVAEGLGERPENLRKLCVAGGTSFDMRNLVKRNQGNFDHMRLAIVELNPRVLAAGLEDDARLKIDLAQHASLSERLLLKDDETRRLQGAEWCLPLLSARRPLSTAFLNVMNPDPGSAMIPNIDRTLHTVHDWHVPDPARAVFTLKHEMTPDEVARRIISHWRPSKLLDQVLREFLARLKVKNVTVILHQMPIHPDVVKGIQTNPDYAKSYADFLTMSSRWD